MRRLSYILVLAALIIASGCSEKEKLVLIHTKFGDMKVLLYDETPLHKENFLTLVNEGKYDSTQFHRIIKNFMIQGGDITAKASITPEEKEAERKRTVPAEFVDKFIHVKGALAAARQGDQINPEKASSGSQFYIVHGDNMEDIEKLRNDGQRITALQQIIGMPKYKELRDTLMAAQQRGDTQLVERFFTEGDTLIAKEFPEYKPFALEDSVKQRYGDKDGAPHLDGTYTVFGKVVEGLEIVDSVAAVQTGAQDRPTEPLYVTMEIVEESKKDVTSKYGYTYPEEGK